MGCMCCYSWDCGDVPPFAIVALPGSVVMGEGIELSIQPYCRFVLLFFTLLLSYTASCSVL